MAGRWDGPLPAGANLYRLSTAREEVIRAAKAFGGKQLQLGDIVPMDKLNALRRAVDELERLEND